MKTLIESLFDNDLIEKDPLDNPEFKKWINRPDILWYIYYYWESGEDDWLKDFVPKKWELYKPLVDLVLDIINASMKKVMGPKDYTWEMISFDMYYYRNEIPDLFNNVEEVFLDMMNAANYEILKKSAEEKDGISKSWFRGPFPKNSNVTTLLQQLELPMVKPGKVDGGIFLTNEDTTIILAFPKGTPKNILKLFNIK